ncbi:MAG: DNA polymerase III subunit gamma/tau [Clostridiales bacterium]|nr:DNA polymerase III subunit gamma/tau [Clostridiales bacterium]
MEHIALYRQFRPMTFDEVVEQQHVVSSLRQSVASGQIAHAYLFSGTRGTGKTSVAKIFSRAINCVNPGNGNPCNRCDICKGILDGSILDVIEMDAASNNSVDNIRRICDEVLFMPSRAKFKVYIVDEVHMLSTGAFNALLKTLEEPPRHAVFILATTEPHRIPATIISRCQRYDFRRIPFESIVDRLRDISTGNDISVQDDALRTIAKLADGALRDAISLLDQVSSDASSVITREDILRMTGVVDDRFLLSMASSVLSGNSVSILDLCDQLVMDGRDVLRFTLDLARYFRDLLVISISENPENLVRATAESFTEMRQLCNQTTNPALLRVITRLSELASELKWSPDMRTSFEIALLALGSENKGSGKDPGNSETLQNKTQKEQAPSAKDDSRVGRLRETSKRSNADPDFDPDSHLPPPPEEPGEDQARTPSQEPLVSPHDQTGRQTVSEGRAAPLTPNLTRATEPAPPIHRKSTNLSKVASTPPIRNANIPLPPVIPDDQAGEEQSAGGSVSKKSEDRAGENESVHVSAPQEAQAPADEALSVGHLWDILIKRWEDTMLVDSLQLRHARVKIHDEEMYLVFPDIMRAYIDQLTQRNEYKRIKEDILALISGVREIRLMTDSEADPSSSFESTERSASNKNKTQPDWVGQIKSFAEKNGIEVETIDDV